MTKYYLVYKIMYYGNNKNIALYKSKQAASDAIITLQLNEIMNHYCELGNISSFCLNSLKKFYEIYKIDNKGSNIIEYVFKSLFNGKEKNETFEYDYKCLKLKNEADTFNFDDFNYIDQTSDNSSECESDESSYDSSSCS